MDKIDIELEQRIKYKFYEKCENGCKCDTCDYKDKYKWISDCALVFAIDYLNNMCENTN
jgi:hypothetical protein